VNQEGLVGPVVPHSTTQIMTGIMILLPPNAFWSYFHSVYYYRRRYIRRATQWQMQRTTTAGVKVSNVSWIPTTTDMHKKRPTMIKNTPCEPNLIDLRLGFPGVAELLVDVDGFLGETILDMDGLWVYKRAEI
jgi:hypothetical protein